MRFYSFFLMLIASNSFCFAQLEKPSYIEGYASAYPVTNKNEDTLVYWVQYVGESNHQHIHNYRIFTPEGEVEELKFVTFDTLNLDLSQDNYEFDYIHSTTPTLSVGNETLDIIGAYPVEYLTCYFNDFESTSHKVLCIEKGGGADYPCLVKFEIVEGNVIMDLRREKGLTRLHFNLPYLTPTGRDIVAVDFIHDQILFEGYNNWIPIETELIKEIE